MLNRFLWALNPFNWQKSNESQTKKEQPSLQNISTTPTSISFVTTTSTSQIHSGFDRMPNKDSNDNAQSNNTISGLDTLDDLVKQLIKMRTDYEKKRIYWIEIKRGIVAHGDTVEFSEESQRSQGLLKNLYEQIKDYFESCATTLDKLNASLVSELKIITKLLKENEGKLLTLIKSKKANEADEKSVAIAICDETMAIINDMITFFNKVENKINSCRASEHFFEELLKRGMDMILANFKPIIPLPEVNFESEYKTFLINTIQDGADKIFEREGTIEGILDRVESLIKEYQETKCNKQKNILANKNILDDSSQHSSLNRSLSSSNLCQFKPKEKEVNDVNNKQTHLLERQRRSTM